MKIEYSQQPVVTSKQGQSIVYGISKGAYPFHNFIHNTLAIANFDVLMPAMTIVTTGKDEWTEGCMRYRTQSTLTSLEYLVEGEMLFETPRGEFTIQPGQVFIVHYNEDSRMTALSKFLIKRTLIMPGELTSQLVCAMGLHNVDYVEMNEFGQSTLEAFDKIYAEIEKHEQGYNSRITQQAFNILVNIRQLTSTSRYPAVLRKTLEYIYSNVDKKLSIEDLSKFARASSGTLNNLFNKYFQISTAEYVSQHKIKLAKTMLLHENSYIKEIAAKLGYANQFYFSADFKKRTGQTPKQFRESKNNLLNK